MFKIALDAGHGKNTPGKRCLKSLDKNETREWVLNARICEKIAENLKSYSGYALRRMDDVTGATDIPLRTRTNNANAWGADIYLSVHHDAGLGGKKGGGATVYVYTQASADSKQYQSIIYDEFIKQTGEFGNRANPKLPKDLHVCRETNMPAVLIECGFMDSPSDVPMILSEDFANKAAKGLTNALVKIGKLTKKDGAEPVEKFTDIKGHFAEKAISDLAEMGIVNGKGNGQFAPNDTITRAEAAIMIRNAIRYITGK
jgi:N-acetylmuramoyl-L-alanine amidase